MASVGLSGVKAVARDTLVYAGAVLLAPLWLPALVERLLRLGDGWFAGCAELLSLAPGKPGIFLRRSFYRMTLDRCATDVHIGFGSLLTHPEAEIQCGVYVGPRCTIGKVAVEEHATIGGNVDILSGRRQHRFDRTDRPIQEQGGRFTRIGIGRNSWIGNSAVVMADVGANCVIGAGSVVVKPIPPASLAVGNPSTVIRSRAAQDRDAA
jgi:acetyltransferase-like isoleucine patch superfamily enzyme